MCRPGGYIALTSIENEGEREQYAGLHQWNLEARDGTIWLWNRLVRENLLSRLPGPYTFTCFQKEPPPKGYNVFMAEIRKS